MIQAVEIRSRFIEFFAARGHKIVSSAPLVPPDDPTLLFTTAGMVQFKSLYSGAGPLPYARAATVQKCLRAGGKGSDLDNVGRTLRHHTFFEMLGNFSFGDYFKKEAIAWAWEFCTSKEWLGLPGERIWATIYGVRGDGGEWRIDEDAHRFWKEETGVVNPVTFLDEEENFWGPAGDTGACGPCSEIKFFMGTDDELKNYQQLAASGEEGMAKVARDLVEEGDLFLEIWNLVFPQYDRQLDGSRPQLRNRGIDTGAGLERTTTACQMIESGGKIWSPYETDLLQPIVRAVAEIAGLPHPRVKGDAATEAKLREAGRDPADVRLAMNACADHARALTFALAEGIVPSNEGRGYVIRRILRRAARFGKKIGVGDPFLWRLVAPVVETMGVVYPELKQRPEQIEKTIRLEEERFSRTLHLGSEMLDQVLQGKKKGDNVSGVEAFRLYDTYGFPLDLAIEIAEERGVGVDAKGFEKCLAKGKARARATWKGGGGAGIDALRRVFKELQSEFTGHDELESRAQILSAAREGEYAEIIEEGQTAVIVLDRTPFYGEGGGQIGDSGAIESADGVAIFRVEDTQKTDDGCFMHFGEALSFISLKSVGEVVARVDAERRLATMKNHSVTHLLQGSLKRLVGGHVTQSGSFVGPDRLRFDFTNPEPIDEATLREIEAMVNARVQENLPVTAEEMDLEAARATGAIAPFGEKYGARVRVVRMGDFSTEFCGGTHVGATGEIGAFIITGESSVAAGIRRIEAQTGPGAVETIASERAVAHRLSRALTVPIERVAERVTAMQEEIKALKRAADRARSEELAGRAGDMPTVRIGDVSACVGWIEGADVEALRSTFDRLKSKHRNEKFLAVLGTGDNGKATLIVGATPDLAGTAFEAGKLIRAVAPLFDGKGGGKPQFAQAGGKDSEKLKAAIEAGRVLEALKSAGG